VPQSQKWTKTWMSGQLKMDEIIGNKRRENKTFRCPATEKANTVIHLNNINNNLFYVYYANYEHFSILQKMNLKVQK
jgi:hypothetical protein